MNTDRIAIFIDGGNLHHLVLKKIGVSELEFDFEKLAFFLAHERIISPNGKRYYVGTVREKEGDLKSKNSMARQTSFFTRLKKFSEFNKTSPINDFK